jgi:hypothetical protein
MSGSPISSIVLVSKYSSKRACLSTLRAKSRVVQLNKRLLHGDEPRVLVVQPTPQRDHPFLLVGHGFHPGIDRESETDVPRRVSLVI